MAQELDNAIFKTLCYFDVRGTPLTSSEVALFLFAYAPTLFGVVETALEALVETRKIDMQNGFYFLPGKSALVEQRRASGILVEQKLARARRGAKVLRFVPFMRAVLVCNSVGEERATKESDIDLFIVGEAKRIWLVRFFSNLLLKMFRLRTGRGHERDRLCLSYFVDTEHLNLASTRVLENDIHLAYWLHQMIPVYDPENFYERLARANQWTEKIIPALRHVRTNGLQSVVKDFWPSRVWRAVWEKFWGGGYGHLVEREAQKAQETLLNRRLAGGKTPESRGIIIGDGIIKLHEHDSRQRVYEDWKQTCATRYNLSV